MTNPDERCSVCGEPRHAHVATDLGPETHPREARGEGTYELVRPGHIQGGFFPGEEYEVGPTYKFVPKPQTLDDK